jgi:bacillopeptidase F (M6 metalloprotease family)
LNAPKRTDGGQRSVEPRTISVAAHEFGHLIGNKDEYQAEGECRGRDPINTGTIMDNNTDNVPARMMQRFADNIGSNVV